ncbi:MAG TPA: site-specific DNA-methyltransferase [Blastocatellia bacterium]|nr:site-specific DNA-methyltransferase [Blastocatellia bacterium]
MTNFESLIARAEQAGLRAQARSSFSDVRFTTQLSLPFDGPAWQSFSACVASLPAGANDRLQPFNARHTDRRAHERLTAQLKEAAARLEENGLMFVYGLPRELTRAAAALTEALTFRYWIAVRTMTASKADGLRPEHTGLLVLSKPGATINRLRISHPRCRHCEQTLKDWGGKSHLMHPEGVRLSDVWMDMVVDPNDPMPVEVFERILDLAATSRRDSLLLLFPAARPALTAASDSLERLRAFDPLGHRPPRRADNVSRAMPADLLDRLHRAPCLDVLRRIPSASVDLAFADPPFNLTKGYEGYKDDLAARDYLGWCKRWLVEYERVLKPGGALFLLNLPKWAVGLADFLSRSASLYLQNWIVWNALPEPKGVLMPAHYALLYFTKGERPARFNYCSMEQGWQPFDEAVFPPDRADVCARRACVRRRRASAQLWRGELTDIWHDIHRERRPIKKTIDEKAHPCATPERLLDRIIRLASNPGDIVLDAFAGTGTTALVAARLNRRFIAIEQADEYLYVADRRLREKRSSWQRSTRAVARGAASKRALQLELKRLALMLGRLPSVNDVAQLSKYTPEMFEQAFASWAAATKAARNALSEMVVQEFEVQHLHTQEDDTQTYRIS